MSQSGYRRALALCTRCRMSFLSHDKGFCSLGKRHWDRRSRHSSSLTRALWNLLHMHWCLGWTEVLKIRHKNAFEILFITYMGLFRSKWTKEATENMIIQSCIWKAVRADRQLDKQTNRQTDKQTNRQTNKQTNKQTNRQTNRQLDRQTDS